MASSFCPHCGAPLRAGAKFCANCGTTIGVAVPAIPSNVGAGSPRPGTQLLTTGPRLLVRVLGQAETELSLTGSLITVGRASDNTIPVPIPEISRHHAQIVPAGLGNAVVDLGSANGTFINGLQIPPNQPMPLKHGDVIRVGDQAGNSISITYLETEAPPRIAGTMPIGAAQFGNMPRASIGRDPQCTIPLPSPVVSWHHAELIHTGNTHQLRDLGSANGTFVNGRPVRSVMLRPGDQVQIGPYKLVYSAEGFEQYSSVGSVRLDGIQLYKAVPTKQGEKIILNNISLSVMPREFIALVGGSGAGKSTLMDALNGFRRMSTGQVLVNGQDLYQNYDLFRTNMGYVPQNDIIHNGLPVGRALRYTAWLRLPKDTPRSTIDQRIESALKQVDLMGQVNQPITSLSGGQRKRVSIAAELLSEPSLFFLDEPTSGLDPGLDKRMMHTLRRLADSGRTIVLTTHATNNIIGQCDNVAFLSYGRLVYYGPPEQAIRHFNVVDFADIYSQLDKPEEAEKREQAYHQTTEYQQLIAGRLANGAGGFSKDVGGQVPRGGAPMLGSGASRGEDWVMPSTWANWFARLDLSSILRQFGILTMRYLDLIINDRISMFILLAVMPIIGMFLLPISKTKSLIGDSAAEIDRLLERNGNYLIAGDAQKLLLMLALSTILLGVFAAAYEIIKERPVYMRERMVNLNVGAYLASKVTVLLGFGFFQALMLLVVVSFKVEMPWQEGVLFPAPVEMYISLVLAVLAGIGLGLLISALVKSSNTVIYLVLVVLFVQIIFSGVLFPLQGAAGSLSVITSTRWAMEGLGASINMDKLNGLSQSFIDEEVEIEGPGGMMQTAQVEKAIDSRLNFNIEYESSAGHLIGVWLLQLFFTAVAVGITGVVLKRQDRQV